MSTWVAVPSKRPVEHVVQWAARWRERGYRVALFIDADDYDRWLPHLDTAHLWLPQPYPGYAKAVNALVARVLHDYQDCSWIVTGGDDVYPDPNHTADEIARECDAYFGSLWLARGLPGNGGVPDWACEAGLFAMRTFGVMQPTGDQYGVAPNHPHPEMRGPYITRVCGSPWMGREFCQRINQGGGPLWPDYRHMFEDEELQQVAIKYGALWQRPDLTHYHEHWARARADKADMPAFLAEVSGPKHWAQAKALFESRKAAGFPGSDPL